ncbi:hypothetical protein L227DRAFT_572610 [Lentinus tigrinus ALCF2SS1-6]|uniref:Uncharacterized protein n=1 Tax=Lentinus tigrinus ALCF2SS1-6 TaxID=1328759 RepID=A0A5C2SI64_9APHY|nr:hypothetical protein L227DRAFT_572610 [Lentinus tigrinus ALCF2SS1-6]
MRTRALAMLISPKLVQAIVDYHDEYIRKHAVVQPWYWDVNEEWVQKLNDVFKLDNSEQSPLQTSATAANVASTSMSTDSEGLPLVQATSAAISGGIVGARDESPLAGVDSDNANPEVGRSPTTASGMFPSFSGPLESSTAADPTATSSEPAGEVNAAGILAIDSSAAANVDVVNSCLTSASSTHRETWTPLPTALHGSSSPTATMLPSSSSSSEKADVNSS